MRASTAVLVVAVTLGCAAPDTAARERLLASESARRLVGVWDITLTADTTSIALRRHPHPAPITGTVVFALDHSGPASTGALRDVTHQGAYDLDLSPFGFTTREGNAPAVAIARLARDSSAAADSLWIVLSPETDRFALRLRGTFSRDSAAGVWTAESYTVGGGTGRFVMHLHPPSR